MSPVGIVVLFLLVLLGVVVFLARVGVKPYVGLVGCVAVLVFLMDIEDRVNLPEANLGAIAPWVLEQIAPAAVSLTALLMLLMIVRADPVGRLGDMITAT